MVMIRWYLSSIFGKINITIDFMKILYVITNSFWYGDNKALYNLIPLFLQYGIEPIFLVPKNSKAVERFAKFSSHIICYNEGNIYYTQKTTLQSNVFKNYLKTFKCTISSFFADKNEYINLKEQVRLIGPDLIHTNNSGCVLGYRLSLSLNIPHVWHIREYGDKDANWSYFPSRYYIINRLNNTLNHNITITEDIKKHFGLSSINSQTIYDGPICGKTSPEVSNDKSYFLFVGRLFPNKGVEMLIDAMSMVVKRNLNVRLKLAGSGEESYVSFLKKKVKALGLDNNTEFLGYREDIANLMGHAKAVIVPSYYEAFGFITTEAMFCGTKVIGYNSAGTKEQMDNVERALGKKICLRFHNTVELSNAILYANNEALDIITLKEASDYVLNTYSNVESAKRVYEYYLRILKYIDK